MEGTIATIMLFGGNFAPRTWALCDGQLLAISANSALFSILGTTFGGDGRSTFALPDLRGRVALHPGTGPGLSPRKLGQNGGSETNTIHVNQMPSHNHTGSGVVRAQTAAGEEASPANNVPASLAGSYAEDANTNMAANSVTVTINNNGGGQPVNNMQPWLAINYVICLTGIYPSRS